MFDSFVLPIVSQWTTYKEGYHVHLDRQYILHSLFVRGLTVISLVGGLGVENVIHYVPILFH
jgi:hypothetical protein